mgnify:CR=1 FL=1
MARIKYNFWVLLNLKAFKDNKQYNVMKRIFPKRENYKMMRTIKVKDNGNFKFYGCETERFMYVICFYTS